MKSSQLFNLNNDKEAKLNIITSLYSAMVSYTQEIRGVVERTTVVGCGLILLLDGWLVTSQLHVNLRGKLVISLAIFGFTCVVIFTIRALQQRFNGFAYIIRRLNQVQMVYEKGAYLENDILFPEYWKNFGTSRWKEPIFRVAYVSLVLVGAFGILAVWFL